MTHYPEHILELYVLHAQEVETRREEIEAHISECFGCKSLVEEMSEFHADLKAEMQKPVEEQQSTALARTYSRVTPYYDDVYETPVAYLPPKGAIQKFQYFARQHPVFVGGSSFAFLAAIFMMFNLFPKSANTVIDQNPVFPRINWTEGTIEIYNKNDERIWKWVCERVGLSSEQLENRQKFLLQNLYIADINGDGRNEVITSLPLASHGVEGGISISNKIKVFTSKEQKLFPDIEISEKIHYKSSLDTAERNYNDRFNIGQIKALPVGTGEEINIFSSAGNVGRSPGMVTRINGSGIVVGQFWHFGNLFFIDTIDFDNDGKKELLFSGINDVEDDTGSFNQYGILLALDPEKIIGKKKSLCTPGFQDLPFSDAEKMYIKFPHSSMNRVLHRNNSPNNECAFSKNRGLQISMSSGPDNYAHDFQYYLTKELRVIEVKTNNTTNQVFAKLVDEGKLKGKIDRAYLEDLKNRVQYWDGEKWSNTWTMINHKERLAVSN